MRKTVVFTKVNPKYGIVIFYYKGTHQIYYLFHTRFRKNVHEFFRNGKSIPELYRVKNWHKNRFLSHVIEGQLISKVKHAIKEDSNVR